jgi:hypothetical protein
LLGGAALAQETTTYSYDGLGRLKASTLAGGPADTRKTGTCFDAAGNRKQYDVTTTTPSACVAPTPTPSPTPTPTPSPTPSWTIQAANLPPVANTDTTSFHCSLIKTLNVTTNDSDPEGNTPLDVQSVVSLDPGSVWSSVVSSSSIQIEANAPGTYSVEYVVADSLGNTSTGVVNITVTGTSNCREGPPLDD